MVLDGGVEEPDSLKHQHGQPLERALPAGASTTFAPPRVHLSALVSDVWLETPSYGLPNRRRARAALAARARRRIFASAPPTGSLPHARGV